MPAGAPMSGAVAEPLPDGLAAALARPEAHPLDPDAARGVRAVETHLSHVFLTRRRAYKLRKAVDLGFVDFSRRAERNADCLREVALNRRLAPDVYLGVAPVERGARGWQVGALGEALRGDGASAEHVVVMRRLAAGRDALSLLAAGRLRRHQVDVTAEWVARFHAKSRWEGAADFEPAEWLARVTGPVEENFRFLSQEPPERVPRAALARAVERARSFVAAHSECFDERRRAGRVVDGHGDLHLQHVFFERDDAPPLLIDCLEFREDLRRIDAAAEVAFLAMDFAYRGRSDLAERFLGVYAAASDDYSLFRVVDYFVAYRAAVRAKVAAAAAGDAGLAHRQRAAAGRSAIRHLALSARALGPGGAGPARGPALIVLCGQVGSGKSSVARVLADAVGGVVVASDRVRKRLAGLADRERPAVAEALYAPERRDAVYDAMLERAAPVLDSGRVALLDATFARAEQRARARGVAAARGVPAFLVEARCGRAVSLARLARREAADRDASDAGPAVYQATAAAFEPPREWPRATRAVVATDRPWRLAARALARRLRQAAAIRAGSGAADLPGRSVARPTRRRTR